MSGRSLRELVGKSLLVGISGVSTGRQEERFIKESKAAGVILFSRNISDPKQCWELCSRLRSMGLYVAIDHEGGRVHRFATGPCKTPPFREIGRLRDQGMAARIGELHGLQLAALGFQVNFSPCLDLDTFPESKVIGDRSFSSAPGVVAQMGLAYWQALEEKGVRGCGKHFPGHGAVPQDSHLCLPVSSLSRRDWNEHLSPFKAAIDAGFNGLMSAHILCRELDDTWPSSLSSKILGNLLRLELSYDGLLFSDDLLMGALGENYDIQTRVVKAKEAGNDILLLCSDPQAQDEALGALCGALETGVLKKDTFERSAMRLKYYLEKARARPVGSEEELNRVLQLSFS